MSDGSSKRYPFMFWMYPKKSLKSAFDENLLYTGSREFFFPCASLGIWTYAGTPKTRKDSTLIVECGDGSSNRASGDLNISP